VFGSTFDRIDSKRIDFDRRGMLATHSKSGRKNRKEKSKIW